MSSGRIMQNIQIQNVDKIQTIRCLNSALETYFAGHGGNLIFVRTGQIFILHEATIIIY